LLAVELKRHPTGAAKTLMRILAKAPEVALAALKINTD